jgi:hypothetical protein
MAFVPSEAHRMGERIFYISAIAIGIVLPVVAILLFLFGLL